MPSLTYGFDCIFEMGLDRRPLIVCLSGVGGLFADLEFESVSLTFANICTAAEILCLWISDISFVFKSKRFGFELTEFSSGDLDAMAGE
jgi:hypothetical protein